MSALDARFQLRVQRYGWDKAAPHYERFWARQLAPAQDRLLELAAIAPGERVLDVACGTGLVTFPVARAVGSGGTVVATDLSQQMVEAVRRSAAALALPQVRAERMDAEDLRLPDASFDVALCGLGLMYAPDPLRAVQEMRRALAPGGRAAAAVWGERSNCGWAEIFPIVDARVASEVCPMFFHLGTGDALRLTFETAGFSAVRTERIATVLCYESGDDACGAAFAGGPVALAYSRFDERTRAEAHGEYLASIAPFRDGDGYRIPGEFALAVGRA